MSFNDRASHENPLDIQFNALNLGQSPYQAQQQQQQQQHQYSSSSPSHYEHTDPFYNHRPYTNDYQSASARFERFFNTAPSPSNAEAAFYGQHSAPFAAGPSTSPQGIYQAPSQSSSDGPFAANVGAGTAYGGGGAGAFTHAGGESGAGGASSIGGPFFHRSFTPSAVGGGAGIAPTPAPSHSWGPERSFGTGNGPASVTSPMAAQSSLPSAGFYGSHSGDFHSDMQMLQHMQQLQPSPLPFQRSDGPQGAAPPIPTDDDVIPTAIVVKNIPFSVKREQLLQVIEDLAIPVPYAFNYHFDQGVFRGLAFANFRTPEEADAVVAALNGFDVSGRKLRVEYKKVLQAGEKERIEKEKALKRMRSMQLEKDRIRTHSDGGASRFAGAGLPAVPPMPAGISPGANGGGGGFGFESGPMGFQGDMSGPSGADARQGPSHGRTSPTKRDNADLDLNDPQTLEIYSRILLFKDDRMRDELAFSRNLNPQERRSVHLVAQRLSLYHYSVGDADDRHVLVTKHEMRSHNANGGGGKSLRSQASTIGRSHRGDSGFPGGLGASDRASTMLRGKKSAPDFSRRRDRDNGPSAALHDGRISPAGFLGGHPGQGGANGLHNNHLMSRKSNGSLREGYATGSAANSFTRRSGSHLSSTAPGGGGGGAGGGGGGIGGAAGLQSLFSSAFDVPPVPSLGSSPYGAANLVPGKDHAFNSFVPSSVGQQGLQPATSSSMNTAGAIRQPKGPPAPGSTTDNRNFAPRQRSTVPIPSGRSSPFAAVPQAAATTTTTTNANMNYDATSTHSTGTNNTNSTNTTSSTTPSTSNSSALSQQASSVPISASSSATSSGTGGPNYTNMNINTNATINRKLDVPSHSSYESSASPQQISSESWIGDDQQQQQQQQQRYHHHHQQQQVQQRGSATQHNEGSAGPEVTTLHPLEI